MSRPNIFEFKTYKPYILAYFDALPNFGRGQRKHLATAVGCQTPFITHVLNGDYHFSLEQAEAACRWMALSESETAFFLLLVMRDRSGSSPLTKFLSRQIDERLEREFSIKKKVKIAKSLDLEAQVTYYSHWLYAAVHMALLQPELRTIAALEQHFSVPSVQLLSVLRFLAEQQLIESSKGAYRVLQPMLHLPRGSKLLSLHHTQWRLKAIEASQINESTNMHYSVVMSLSRGASDQIRAKLAHFIEEVAEVVKPSPDEQLACLCLDLFKV